MNSTREMEAGKEQEEEGEEEKEGEEEMMDCHDHTYIVPKQLSPTKQDAIIDFAFDSNTACCMTGSRINRNGKGSAYALCLQE